MDSNRMRNYVKTIKINLVLILCALAVAEIIFGSWVFGPSYSFLNIRRGEQRLLDVSELIRENKVIKYTRDEHGFRGDYGNNPANIDIVAIGGSTTDERFLGDNENWVAKLQQKFVESNIDIRVVNAGVDGQSTRGHIVALERWFPNIEGFKPRFILGYVGINDVALGSIGNQYDNMESPSVSRRIRQYLMNHSVFYDSFRKFRGWLLAGDAKVMHGSNSMRNGSVWRPVIRKVDPDQMRSHITGELKEYKRRLKELALRIKEFGSEPIFVTQPRGDYMKDDDQLLTLVSQDQIHAGWEPSNESQIKMRLYNDITMSVCREAKIMCFDLAQNIKLEPSDFYDSLHTMPSGSEKIAKYLHAQFLGVIK